MVRDCLWIFQLVGMESVKLHFALSKEQSDESVSVPGFFFLSFFLQSKDKIHKEVLCSCALELKSLSGRCKKESRDVASAQTRGLAGFQPSQS